MPIAGHLRGARYGGLRDCIMHDFQPARYADMIIFHFMLKYP